MRICGGLGKVACIVALHGMPQQMKDSLGNLSLLFFGCASRRCRVCRMAGRHCKYHMVELGGLAREREAYKIHTPSCPRKVTLLALESSVSPHVGRLKPSSSSSDNSIDLRKRHPISPRRHSKAREPRFSNKMTGEVNTFCRRAYDYRP